MTSFFLSKVWTKSICETILAGVRLVWSSTKRILHSFTSRHAALSIKKEFLDDKKAVEIPCLSLFSRRNNVICSNSSQLTRKFGHDSRAWRKKIQFRKAVIPKKCFFSQSIFAHFKPFSSFYDLDCLTLICFSSSHRRGFPKSGKAKNISWKIIWKIQVFTKRVAGGWLSLSFSCRGEWQPPTTLCWLSLP